MNLLPIQFRHIALCVFILVLTQTGFAQTHVEDQRLITLKNGYQLMGYIVEQRPGIDLKLYRPSEKDTMTVKVEDIKKVSRISVTTTSKKENKDSLFPRGRFNYKKNVYQFSYVIGMGIDYGGRSPGFLQGVNLAYYRNLHNRFYIGGSINYLKGGQDYQYATSDWEVKYFSVLTEGKMRFSKKPQNKRIATWLGVQLGFIQNKAYYWDEDLYKVKYEITGKNRFAAGTSLSIKINPDSNSGFCLEPSVLFFRPEITRYTLGYQYSVLSYTINHGWTKLFAVRCSYYF